MCESLVLPLFLPQIQQRLMQLETPPELRYHDDPEIPTWTAHRTHSHISKQAYTTQQCSSNEADHQQHPAHLHCHSTPAGQQVSTRPSSPSPVYCQHPAGYASTVKPALIRLPPAGSSAAQLPSWPATGIAAGDAGLDLAMHTRTKSCNSEPAGADRNWRENLRSILCPCSATSKHSGSMVVSGASEDLAQHAPWHTASKSSSPAAPVLSGSARRPSSLGRWLSSGAGGWWRALLSHSGSTGQPGLFKGLRVRVGLATGPITKGQAVETSPPYSMARGVRCAAAAGKAQCHQSCTFCRAWST
jgi:hypothetical protein